ncbi:hypothetical protein HZS_1228 [Henneguya salminicola]|nr:hypothetical protein HZS_1228 [Henneguya salminicola]
MFKLSSKNIVSKHDFTNSIQIIEPLMNIIKEHQQKNSINVLNNVKNFGLLRLLVLEILVALILYNDENLAAELAKVDLPNFLMDLFEKFPENNLVHSLIELAISSILMGYRWKSRTGTHLFVDNTLISSLFSSDIFIKKILYLSTQRKNYIAHVREILRTLFKTTADSYHKNFIIEKNQNISESLKEEIMTAEANLHRIEEIEAIDTVQYLIFDINKKFLRVISDDFDNQDTYFTNDIITQPYKTIENSIEYFTTEKTTKLFEDNVDIIEDRMCLNINTGSIPDPFSKMNIKLSKIFLNFEAIDGIKAEVEEQLTDVLKQEFSTTPSAWSNLQEDQISDERNDHSLTPTIKLFQHKTPSISSDYQNIIIDAKEDITIDTNLIKTGRCATSSPLSNVSADISGDESDAFENESTPQQT